MSFCLNFPLFLIVASLLFSVIRSIIWANDSGVIVYILCM